MKLKALLQGATVVVVLGLLALLVYFVRQDWRRAAPPAAAHGATHSIFTSV